MSNTGFQKPLEIILEWNEKEMQDSVTNADDCEMSSGSGTQAKTIVISDLSCHAEGQFKCRGSLKVKTQLDSLAGIAQSSESQLIPERTPEAKLVKFTMVELREYARVLSDHPSTSSGAPIGIGWKYDPKDTTSLDLNLYERSREGLRRTKRQLVIPRDVRESMLREIGYSTREILEAVRMVRKVKERRAVSFHQQKFDTIIEKVETMKDILRPWNCLRRSSIDSIDCFPPP
ncbi:hypothetical protein ACHAW5_002403 [Stephanodiscus triporus]|uniref:Uncharacterized protein n=1 Tax=Stephanodiscus triporus TaxID=2934178 RepID=A0ABD3PN54_9STRA